MPDFEGLQKFKDIIDLVRDAAQEEVDNKKIEGVKCKQDDDEGSD